MASNLAAEASTSTSAPGPSAVEEHLPRDARLMALLLASKVRSDRRYA